MFPRKGGFTESLKEAVSFVFPVFSSLCVWANRTVMSVPWWCSASFQAIMDKKQSSFRVGSADKWKRSLHCDSHEKRKVTWAQHRAYLRGWLLWPCDSFSRTNSDGGIKKDKDLRSEGGEPLDTLLTWVVSLWKQLKSVWAYSSWKKGYLKNLHDNQVKKWSVAHKSGCLLLIFFS